jgi:hypothetical protein
MLRYTLDAQLLLHLYLSLVIYAPWSIVSLASTLSSQRTRIHVEIKNAVHVLPCFKRTNIPHVCLEKLMKTSDMISGIDAEIWTREVLHAPQPRHFVGPVLFTAWHLSALFILRIYFDLSIEDLLTAKSNMNTFSHILITKASLGSKFRWIGNFFLILYDILNHQSWRQASKQTQSMNSSPLKNGSDVKATGTAKQRNCFSLL